jgi:putative transposase
MHQGMNRDRALEICGLSKHQFYHRPSGGKPGRRPSECTDRLVDNERQKLPNAEVVEAIRGVLAEPMADYGYHRMCGQLTLMGFYINPKKVYRLMKEAMLLQPRRKSESKQNVKYRIVCPEQPLRLLEMDIKRKDYVGMALS